jgi:septal ring factor EnvC (AmiA/AmiB activator)
MNMVVSFPFADPAHHLQERLRQLEKAEDELAVARAQTATLTNDIKQHEEEKRRLDIKAQDAEAKLKLSEDKERVLARSLRSAEKQLQRFKSLFVRLLLDVLTIQGPSDAGQHQASHEPS